MSYQLRNLCVLVIDDNRPIRSLIKSLLIDLGVGRVETAVSGEEGYKMYCEEAPDIILVDWRMEGMNGIEFTRKVRNDSDSPNRFVPIIIMTGYTNKERVFEARDAGVTEFLIKPFTVSNLAKYIGHVIENPRKFVVSSGYVGPDRRRRAKPAATSARARRAEDASNAPKALKKSEVKRSPQYVDLRGDNGKR